MDGKLPDFPRLFEILGVFLFRLMDCADPKYRRTPEQIGALLHALVTEHHSPSEAENAFDAYKTIVTTIYPESFGGGCPSGNPRIKA